MRHHHRTHNPESRFHHQCALKRTIMGLPVLFALLFAQLADAQVPDSQTDLSQLQKQLSMLQNQIASLEKKSSNSEPQDSRVRSVGSSRVSRIPEPVNEVSLQIRLYDLSDLFVASPSYPAQTPDDLGQAVALFSNGSGGHVGGMGQGGGGFGGGGGGVFRVSPVAPRSPAGSALISPGFASPKQEAGSLGIRSAQVSMTQMVKTIKGTVQPEMWGDDADQAKVQFLGNTLLITATDEMHSQITNLLNLFREHWGRRRTITVQTYWIRADAGDTADLLDEKSTEIGAGVVDQKKWAEYFAAARTEKRFAYSATLTGHNNQTLYALSGQMLQLTVGAEPFKSTHEGVKVREGADGEDDDGNPFGDGQRKNRKKSSGDLYHFRNKEIVGFSPIRKTFHNGTAIQVTPLATRGGNFVIVDLHAKINELMKPVEGSEERSIFVRHGESGKTEVKLDSTDFVAGRLNTTLRCPKGQVVLAGEMTLDPNSEREHPNVYLFVKTSVHTITEDKSDWTRQVPETSTEKSFAQEDSPSGEESLEDRKNSKVETSKDQEK